MTITGWSLVGLGAVAISTGIAMGVMAHKRASEVEEAYAIGQYDWADIKSKETVGKRDNVLMIVGLSVGIAAAGGGTALLLLAPRQERRVAVAPLLDPRMLGATLAWRY